MPLRYLSRIQRETGFHALLKGKLILSHYFFSQIKENFRFRIRPRLCCFVFVLSKKKKFMALTKYTVVFLPQWNTAQIRQHFPFPPRCHCVKMFFERIIGYKPYLNTWLKAICCLVKKVDHWKRQTQLGSHGWRLCSAWLII